MSPANSHLDRYLDALLEGGKAIPPVPGGVRARALARARAAAEIPAAAEVARGPEPMPIGRRPRLVFALAASIAVVACAAGAVAALYLRTSQNPPPVPMQSPRMAPEPSIPTALPPLPTPTVTSPKTVSAKPYRPARPPTAQESYAAELRLLQRAHGACALQDFANALALVAEHRRQFPNGRLAEEREALRVRALVGAGRMDEARRTAAAFAERFPRSVLLPRLGMEGK